MNWIERKVLMYFRKKYINVIIAYYEMEQKQWAEDFREAERQGRTCESKVARENVLRCMKRITALKERLSELRLKEKERKVFCWTCRRENKNTYVQLPEKCDYCGSDWIVFMEHDVDYNKH